MLEVYDLQCEQEKTPLAVTALRPRFSWKLRSDRRAVTQIMYRMEVGIAPEFGRMIWDSGSIAGSASHLVEYDGPPLAPCTRYFYRVGVRDDQGEESRPSEVSWFETAPAPDSWKAKFIGMERPNEAATSRPIYFRREFTVDGEPRRARVYATALGIYELMINGRRVGEDYFTPGWTNYRKRLAFQVYDVTSLLHPGPNAIGAVVGPGWYKGDLTWLNRRNFYGEATAVSLELRATDSGGREMNLLSDGSWRAAQGAILYSEFYHGEQYDAREEQSGWSSFGFDDSDWVPVVVREFDRGRLLPQDGPPVRKQEHFAVCEVLHTPKGETVLDFGQNITGWVRFSVRGKAGDRVVLRHAEVLDADGNFYTENLRTARAEITYTLKGGGRESFEPHFTFHGFRYVHVAEYPGTVDPADFTAVVLHSHMRPTLSFACSDPLLNQLHHNILWGWKGNTVDVPTDCAQRDERLGWTGDTQVFIGTAAYLSQAATFYRKWLRDLASEQLADGGVPFVVPDVLTLLLAKEQDFGGGHSSSGWGDAAVICPWTTFLHYGDLRALREQYPSMKAWIEYIRSHAEGGLIWNTGFHFGDWLALDAKEGSSLGATPNDLIATAFYAYSVEILSRAAAVIGEADDVSEYTALHDSIVEAFRNEFITPTGRVATRTQTADVLSLVFGLVPDAKRTRVVDDLVALIEENGGHLTTGFLGTPFICRALAENGRLHAAYSLLLRKDCPSWLYQVARGATTVWEHWDGIRPDGTMWNPEMNSFNHYAYGAIGEWIYSTVGGISPDPQEPGFHTVIFSPKPGGGLTHAKTCYESPYGTVELEWRLDGDRLVIDATVPANSRARFVLDGVAAGDIESPNRVEFADHHGAAVAVVGSGRYRVECGRGNGRKTEN